VEPLSPDTDGVGQDPVEAAAEQPAPSHLAATMARTRSRVRCADPLLAPAALREPRAVIDDEARLPREIRVAEATRDAVQLSRLLTGPEIERHLQELGEAVLSLLEQDRAAAAGVAHALAASLTAREWPGDGELAELLLELAEDRPSERRRIRADLDGVTDLLEGPADMGFGGILDCRTGDTWPAAVIDDWAGEGDPPDPDAEPDLYLFIPNVGSREAWEDMRDFATDVEVDAIRAQLLDAIDGRGAFSRFRRILARHDELRARWYAYSAETRAGRARDWLAAEGYAAMPPPR
jgi:hypothetical protein